eukprot:3000443-Pleurochrysis_carterae.AAC.1
MMRCLTRRRLNVQSRRLRCTPSPPFLGRRPRTLLPRPNCSQCDAMSKRSTLRRNCSPLSVFETCAPG